MRQMEVVHHHSEIMACSVLNYRPVPYTVMELNILTDRVIYRDSDTVRTLYLISGLVYF